MPTVQIDRLRQLVVQLNPIGRLPRLVERTRSIRRDHQHFMQPNPGFNHRPDQHRFMTEPRQIRDPHPQPRIDQPGRQGGNQSNLIPINPEPLILSITVASHQLENRAIEIIDIHRAQ